jgi:hypothetical protein
MYICTIKTNLKIKFMKKFILSILSIFMFIACEKNMPQDNTASLSFYPEISKDNSISKLDADVINFIKGKVDAVNIYLSSADTVIICRSNERIRIPFGFYEISAEYTPSVDKNGCATEPWLKSDTLVLNLRKTQDIVIPMEYICSIFIQENEYYEEAVPKKQYIDYRAVYLDDNDNEVAFHYDGNYNYNYIFTNRDTIHIKSKAIGYDWSNDDNDDYYFSKTVDNNVTIPLVNGRCYMFNPIDNGRRGFNYSTIDM